MPYIRVIATHIVPAAPGVNVVYSPTERVRAPRAHAESIVAAGAGELLPDEPDDAPDNAGPAEPSAHDAP